MSTLWSFESTQLLCTQRAALLHAPFSYTQLVYSSFLVICIYALVHLHISAWSPQLQISEANRLHVASSSEGVSTSRVAVCLAGAARTFVEPLTFQTLIAALTAFDDVKIDFFSWLSNDPIKGDVNSKSAKYPAVRNGEVRRIAALFARSSNFGSFSLNEANYEPSSTCDFGVSAKKKFDRSTETVLKRQTDPMFKREKCFETIVAAEEEIQLQFGGDWRYKTIISLRPDIFFFSELKREQILPHAAIFPAPAHDGPRWADGTGVNDHVAFLPRAEAENFFKMAQVYRDCNGTFHGAVNVCSRIKEVFQNSIIDSTAVIPYSLNRLGTKSEGICDRVTHFKRNIQKNTTKATQWRKQCLDFTSWFLSQNGTSVKVFGEMMREIHNFWKKNQLND
eukprot:CAMPEP_0179622956 /NCGR_PEP_ID=MMETSP0932-20121108/2000_1 /TAXON_ID=548131 ORGANISM="Ostreococcus mediterraneus, Strain clade-D-RCC2596" /NCGR_SAMPLE_ID=MMETSP0932 /ASSEMBLY_ACC=CAM_ASM_000582 /LENGTH=393 /DNA_ID=CAMNT_0021492103 /DNA_START=426 /DNA_END=1607 /DNA_ORIENTATION=-